VPAAIWRKRRLRELSAEDASMLIDSFEWDFFAADAFAIVETGDRVLDAAARSLAAHALRAYDAVQLGAALEARAADPDLARFACFDAKLSAAARAEGFRIVG
jgi:hypothetical protein